MEGERRRTRKRTCAPARTARSIVEDLQMPFRRKLVSWSAAEHDAPERVWTSLRAQLEQEGLIRETIPVSVAAHETKRLAPDGSAVYSRDCRARRWQEPISPRWSLRLSRSVGPVNKRVNEARWLKGTQNSTSPLSAQLNSAEQNSISSSRVPIRS